MFPFLSKLLSPYWGPFRLLDSRMMLMLLGTAMALLLTFFLLPKCYDALPHDRGKQFVAGAEAAKGKPTGAGFPMTIIFIFCAFLVLPFYWEYALIGLALFAIMMTGYLDDRSTVCWGEWKKGTLDLIISLFAAWVISRWQGTAIWLPFFKGGLPGGTFLIPLWLYLPCATLILWIAINTANCSDGVDGVAGSLAMYGLAAMGIFLYTVMGHATITSYLLLPLVENGASWSIMIFTAIGALGAYLWYNAHPSQVMMGDAGSRFLGLLIGLSVLVSGNPFMIFVAAPILLFNGGLGLIKMLILRGLKRLGYDTRMPLALVVNPLHPERFATPEEAARQCRLVRFLHKYRFPIHDHCRKRLGWSDPQVLIRFMLLQTALMPLMAILMIKLR